MSFKISEYEERQYGGALSSNFIESIADLTTRFAGFMDIESDGFFLTIDDGGVAVVHSDGWRAGYIKPYESWFVFVPDYKELNDV